MQPTILHADLDSFFVSVERLFDKNLIGKPVIVGGTGNRGVVLSCSYEARQFGIHSAMPVVKARRLCPNGIYLWGKMSEYGRYSKMVTDIIAGAAPLFEKASIDEFYIDLTGMDRFFGTLKWSAALREKITRETGLPISFGISINKMMAKMATNEAKPNGLHMIPFGKEQEFLDPLPVGKIPFCGDKTVALLNEKGVYTIGDLRQFSPKALMQWLGEHGSDLWDRAHGKATALVQPYRVAKSMSSERTFDVNTNDIPFLNGVIIALAEKLAFELREENKLTGCVTIKIRYSDFTTHTRQLAIPVTANSKVLIEKALHIFREGYEQGREVRLMGIRFSALEEGAYQINLFDDREKDVLLYKAVDELKHKHGLNKITLAQNLGMENVKRNGSRAALNKDVNSGRKREG